MLREFRPQLFTVQNMFTKDDGGAPSGATAAAGFKRPRTNPGPGGFAGSPAYGGMRADDGPVIPIQPVGYAPVSNTGDNQPCSTLFVGNLSDQVRVWSGGFMSFRQRCFLRVLCFLDVDVCTVRQGHLPKRLDPF